jgi:hypothetical protein
MSQLVLGTFGLAVFVALMAWIWRSGAYRWRRLAAAYGLDDADGPGAPLAERHMQSLILRGGRPAWQSHSGITTVGVHETGLAFRLMFPFSIDHPPFFIPFHDLQARVQDWYLNCESYELDTRREQDIKLIVDQDLMHWIEQVAGDRWPAGYSLMDRVARIHDTEDLSRP